MRVAAAFLVFLDFLAYEARPMRTPIHISAARPTRARGPTA